MSTLEIEAMKQWRIWQEESSKGFNMPMWEVTSEPIEAESFDHACEHLAQNLKHVEKVDGEWVFAGVRLYDGDEYGVERSGRG